MATRERAGSEANEQTDTATVGGAENARNERNRTLYTKILRAAGVVGRGPVVIGHHLIYAAGGKLHEIPGADTLIFDHDIAKAVFGAGWAEALTTLALTPTSDRDEVLRDLFNRRK